MSACKEKNVGSRTLLQMAPRPLSMPAQRPSIRGEGCLKKDVAHPESTKVLRHKTQFIKEQLSKMRQK